MLAVIAGFFLVATIVLAVLYSMERNKNRFNQTEQGTYYPIVSGEDNWTETFDINSNFNEQRWFVFESILYKSRWV